MSSTLRSDTTSSRTDKSLISVNMGDLAGRQGFEPSRTEQREVRDALEARPASQRLSKSEGVGWEAGIRTPIPWSSGGPRKVGDLGAASVLFGKTRGSFGRLRSEAGPLAGKDQVFFH